MTSVCPFRSFVAEWMTRSAPCSSGRKFTGDAKDLNGHTDVIAGAVAGTDQVVDEVRRLMQVWGQAIDPFAAWLIDRGMRTLTVRVQRQNKIGLAVAEWCAKQDAQ